MKSKIIKLTESQVKKIIDNVVNEQIANQTPQQQFKEPQSGQVYNAPYIKSSEDLDKFVNYGAGIKDRANFLASIGLDLRNMADRENAAIKQGVEPGKTTQILYILNSISSFLDIVARLNIPSKSVKVMSNQILQKMDEKDINKNYKQYLPMIFSPTNTGLTLDQYWTSLSKLVDLQRNKLGAV